MSDQRKRRIRPARPPRRVGEPNVLSNQAIPNRLSTMGPATRPASPASAAASQPSAPTRPVPPRPTTARPGTSTDRPGQEPEENAPARRRGLPSFGTLLFIAFAIYWAVRAFGNAGLGEQAPTTAPAPGGAGVGIVAFGRGVADDCSLTQPADRFESSVAVWWRAELAREQAPNAAAVVRAYHDEGQIERMEVPAEPELGAWDVLCAGEPVAGNQVGTYRVEVWDAAEKELLAVGTYTKVAASP